MKKLVKNFNNFIKKTIFKPQNNTNYNSSISKFNKHLVKNFNNFIKKTIFKLQNNTNYNSSISKFNKYLITFVSLLFFYLFYLSIPVLYEKNWVQRNIENKLLKEFKIKFSLSSNISYRILPSPHYLIKNSKIFKKDNKITSLVEIKTLKVFISQKNFFDKNKIYIKYVKIDNADFTLLKSDLKLLKDSTNNKFSNKKIEINKSNIFFKNNLNEIVSIVKISKAFFFKDDKNLLNLFRLKGEIFNIPFNFDYNKSLAHPKNEVINITAKKIRLKIFNKYDFEEGDYNKGKNIVSFLNSKIITNYRIENDIIIFSSNKSRIKNSKVNYNGKVSINPFDLNLNIDLDNYDIHKFFNSNSILSELIKSNLLFNKNISMNTSINVSPNLRNKIFQEAKINFNIIDGKLNINKTRLINKKIGVFEVDNSNLSFEDNRLSLSTDIAVKINNSEELFSLLQTNKKFRKPINNILINLDYDFLTKIINFNYIKIDNQEISDELLRFFESFNNNEFNNWNKNKNLLNVFFKVYEG